MTRALAGTSLVAAVAVAGCFRGDFLDDTCEQRGGCDDSTTGVVSTTGASATTPTTSTGGTSTGEPPDTTGGGLGVLLEGPAFRVTALEIIDPPLFTKFLGMCTDASGFINGSLMASVQNYDTNLILVAKDYDPAKETQDFLFYSSASCPPGENYCVLNPALLPTTFVAANLDAGSCGYVDMTTVNPTNYGFLHQPMAPCVVSPTASIEIKLSNELPAIQFLLGKFAAEYRPTAEAPDRLEHATLQGFIPEANAMNINYTYMNTPINLWSVIRGSGHPEACPIPMDMDPGSVDDVDVVDVDGPEGPGAPIRGVFLYMNFTAKKLDVYAPL